MKLQKQFRIVLLGKDKLVINKKITRLKTVCIAVLIHCSTTMLVNAQTIKLTGGVDVMSVKFKSQIENGDINDPGDTDPGDTDPGDTDAPARLSNSLLNSRAINTATGTNSETGFYLGLALSDIKLFNNFELQPELRFVAVKDFNQIQLPVLLRYAVSEKFHALAGPNAAFLLNPEDNIKTFNFALDFGVSYTISEKIALDARYDFGLTNLLEDGDSDNYIRVNNIQFGVVYSFGK